MTKRHVNPDIILYASKNNIIQKWKGLFRGPFILQTFAAHLTAIEGSQKILGLHDPDKPTPAAIGALGLAAASVSGIFHAHRVVLTVFRPRGH